MNKDPLGNLQTAELQIGHPVKDFISKKKQTRKQKQPHLKILKKGPKLHPSTDFHLKQYHSRNPQAA